MIYVVMGAVGEYSAHDEWAVRAFSSEDRAQAFVRLLDRTWREAKVKYAEKHGEDYDFGREWADDRWVHPHDPDFKHDSAGTNYYYMAVPLDDEPLPERSESDA